MSNVHITICNSLCVMYKTNCSFFCIIKVSSNGYLINTMMEKNGNLKCIVNSTVAWIECFADI